MISPVAPIKWPIVESSTYFASREANNLQNFKQPFVASLNVRRACNASR